MQQSRGAAAENCAAMEERRAGVAAQGVQRTGQRWARTGPMAGVTVTR
jgi:hypothetical protein